VIENMEAPMLGRLPRHRHTSLTAEPDATGERVSPPAAQLPSPSRAPERLGHASEQAVVSEVLSSPRWQALPHAERKPTAEGVHLILEWLAEHDGDTWQLRWEDANPHDGLEWINELGARGPWAASTRRANIQRSFACLLLVRLIRPSYRFLRNLSAATLYTRARESFRPDLFARAEQHADRLGVRAHQRGVALAVLSNLVLHTGRDLDQLTTSDFLELRAALTPEGRKPPPGISVAWDLARGIARIPDQPIRHALLPGQLGTDELIDAYGLQCRSVRDVIIRYLNERRPVLDYSSFSALARTLGSFWADIEAHHPGTDSLQLSDQATEQWRQRVSVVIGPDGTRRPRLAKLNIFVPVRAFYLDIAQWALTDPSWAQHAVRCPVRRSDTSGYTKNKQQVAARMHQRIRERLPHLLALVDSACDHQAALLAAAAATPPGAEFEHNGQIYRVVAQRAQAGPVRRGTTPAVLVDVFATGQRRDLTREEDEAFWVWAIIETLRHTGVRVEELVELTQLALVSYTLPDTGEVVPLLQIVPSKSNEERLLLVSPELASVLATVITRLRRDNGGTIATVARWDHHERVWTPPLPYLFQRIRDHRRNVIAPDFVNKLLKAAWNRAGLLGAAGQPIYATAHDFRRMFVTEAVTAGLPIHIAAKLLGHASVNTTQAYHAVFQDDLVRSYRSFLDRRRAMRPTEEYREPTDAEWTEFQQHFHTRKLELGDCGRPYGTPCKHEHACVRCPMLRVDPRLRGRLIDIIYNLNDRVAEAKTNGWLGEVEGLQISLDAAKIKLRRLDRAIRTERPTLTNLEMPVIRHS
jgi:integrase